jgi:hypothetical protein
VAPRAASGVTGKCSNVQGTKVGVAARARVGLSGEIGLELVVAGEQEFNMKADASRIVMSLRILDPILWRYGGLQLLEGVHPGDGFQEDS